MRPQSNDEGATLPPLKKKKKTKKALVEEITVVDNHGPLHPDPSCNGEFNGDATEQSSWNAMLFELLLFKSQKGDFVIPHDDPSTKALHDWVQTQRKNYRMYHEAEGNSSSAEDDSHECQKESGTETVNDKKNQSTGQGTFIANEKCSVLTADRISVLNEINFPWNLRGDSYWQKYYDALVEYKSQHGDVKVPRLYAENPRLGEWVTDQRKQYKLKCEGSHSCLTDERKRKLDLVSRIRFNFFLFNFDCALRLTVTLSQFCFSFH